MVDKRARRLGAGAAVVLGAAVAIAAVAPMAGATTSRSAAPVAGKSMMLPRGAAPASVVFGRMSYQGGVGGIGVERNPKLYIVFWGTQWGTASTVGQDLHFTGDTAGAAPIVQQFLRGLFGSQDTWSTSTKQYCDGVAIGATKCGSTSFKIKHAKTTPLAGVWYDNAGLSPAAATDQQLGTEANRAAQHFGNTTAASNASVQYVIVSPHGTNPGQGFGTQYCAWHWDTSPAGAGTPFGDVAFTNLPYMSDVGPTCGSNFVNGGVAGLNDGWTIVEGHEYGETVTDQFFDSSGNPGGWVGPGSENGDKCAWISSGRGAAANISLSTGTFAVQSLFSNNAGPSGNCSIFYATKTNQH